MKKFKITELKDDAYYRARSYYFDLAYYLVMMDTCVEEYNDGIDDIEDALIDLEYDSIKDDLTLTIHMLADNQFFTKDGILLDVFESTEDTPLSVLRAVGDENKLYLQSELCSEIPEVKEQLKIGFDTNNMDFTGLSSIWANILFDLVSVIPSEEDKKKGIGLIATSVLLLDDDKIEEYINDHWIEIGPVYLIERKQLFDTKFHCISKSEWKI